MAAWQRPDPLTIGARDAAGHETLHHAVVVDDAERRILGADQLPDAVDNLLEHAVQGDQPGNAAGGGVERLETFRGLAHFLPRPCRLNGKLNGPDRCRDVAGWRVQPEGSGSTGVSVRMQIEPLGRSRRGVERLHRACAS